MNLDTYWDMTPKVYRKHLEAFSKKQELQARETDFTNFLLGQYIARAVNDPKKYPKKPFLHKEEKKEGVMSSEEMNEIMKHNTYKLGGIVNE